MPKLKHKPFKHSTSAPSPTQERTSWLWLGIPLAIGVLFVSAMALFYKDNEAGEAFDPLTLATDQPIEMVKIPGGTFMMGNDDAKAEPNAKPVHEVKISPFRMGKTEVTNAQFAAFVKATGYKTIAERKPKAEDYPGVPEEALVAGSAVFQEVEVGTEDWRQQGLPHPPWWQYIAGANWRHPTGPDSDLRGKGNLPVVQIAWTDAVEYCKWAKKRLPTEAEWEYAARGGLNDAEYSWGKQDQGANGKWYANTWQGTFPTHDTGNDGYNAPAPVGSFPPNDYGLLDISGNVWEWCSDNYDSNYYANSPKENPQGPEKGEAEGQWARKVRRGGSFLCADEYCRRYIPNARDENPLNSSANHTGFRVVDLEK